MIKMNFKRIIIFTFIPVVFLILTIEVGLRIFMPRLGEDLFIYKDSSETLSWYIFDQEIGYELKPYAVVDFASNDPQKVDRIYEKLNSQGWRGPEYRIPKPKDTYRILVIGDSCVQGFLVGYKDVWVYPLEEQLNRYSDSSGSGMHYEVINAGTGGYVSWQVLKRIKQKGLKYQPDLVLVSIGVNDLLYSLLDYWKPEISLVDIVQFYKNSFQESKRPLWWNKLRMPLYGYSYFARLTREIRNIFWNYQNNQNIIKQHQRASQLPFNQEALKLYLDNLESIYSVLKENNIPMGLIVWPSILTPALIDDYDVHKKLIRYYSVYQLSNLEFLSWFKKYTDAQRNFSKDHPDVLLIDLKSAFADIDKKERLSLFFDLVHPTVKGNRTIAKEIFSQLKQKGITRD
jgi:lysophospholipase L1-like esterase